MVGRQRRVGARNARRPRSLLQVEHPLVLGAQELATPSQVARALVKRTKLEAGILLDEDILMSAIDSRFFSTAERWR